MIRYSEIRQTLRQQIIGNKDSKNSKLHNFVINNDFISIYLQSELLSRFEIKKEDKI
jgi:hypothetical protein